MNGANLSLEQAPPISIPFRFFITAPLFGVAAALLLLFSDPGFLLSRWTGQTLALTHLITLGFLTMIMCGALLQMLPVIGGSPVPRVVLVGTLTHILLTLGTILLSAFFLTGVSNLMLLSLLLLSGGMLLFVTAVGVALWRIKLSNSTITGIYLAVIGLLLTLLFGVLTGAGLSTVFSIQRLVIFTDVHLSWGLLGWVGLLLVSVAYQVVPMFQVTPEYPLWIKKLLTPLLFFSLLFWTVLKTGTAEGYWSNYIHVAVMLPVALGFPIFAITTLWLQKQRMRKVPDVTLMFWWLGMLGIMLCLLVWGAGQLSSSVANSPRYPLFLGVCLLGSGIVVVNGMLYKIVPFLSWFHLQHRQLALMNMSFKMPHMKAFIPDQMAKIQFYLTFLALFVACGAVFQPVWFVLPLALLLALANLLLWVNLLRAARLYFLTNKLLHAK